MRRENETPIRRRSRRETSCIPVTTSSRDVEQGCRGPEDPAEKERKARSRPETVNGFHNGPSDCPFRPIPELARTLDRLLTRWIVTGGVRRWE